MAAAQSTALLRQLAMRDAKKWGVNPQVFVRQINQESGFDTNARSPAGAEGIAQFMPGTAADYHIDPMNPAQALNAAAQYDASELKAFHGDYRQALAAYNAGAAHADEWDNPNFAGGQTYRYVRDILGGAGNPAPQQPQPQANAAPAPSVAAALAVRTPVAVAAPQTDYQPLLAQALSTATSDNYQQFYATLAQALRQRNQPAPAPQAAPVSTAATTQTAQPPTITASSKAGGFLTGNASYKPGRIDQGHDFQTDPGAAIVAPGSGTVVAVKSDPNGFGPAYPIVHFTSGPYAGKDIYIGHTLAALKPGQSFKAGQTISHTGTAPVGNASVPGWAEIGFSTGQLPTGQRPPF